MISTAETIAQHVEKALATHRANGGRCLTVGLCGAQGSGKSTAAAEVFNILTARGLKVAVLSLDDLYLGKAARENLAATVHPLFKTRGVPGTHDVALGIAILDGLVAGEKIRLPRFDKALDEPVPASKWPLCEEMTDIILFEGWCVGARPQLDEALAEPVNDLERIEDARGDWRHYVNNMLAGPYQFLFQRIDTLVLLAAPDMKTVVRWRQEQEHRLREMLRDAGRGTEATMDDAGVIRFVQHYERITRHILNEMPSRSQLLIRLDADRRAIQIVARE